jgi:hypothetical protein
MTNIDWDRIHNIEHFLNKDEKVAIERSRRYKEDVSFLIATLRSIKQEDYYRDKEEWRNEFDKRKIAAMNDIIMLLGNYGIHTRSVPCAGDE